MSKKNKKKNYNHNMVETNEVKEKKKESKIKNCCGLKAAAALFYESFVSLIFESVKLK